ncbi:MAG: hypothetical protein A2W09_06125 [Deltaproteobacteria bacterium RBG_16_50_11]|nr:MAG: hypothetical protein A2W09_06125 [Deltaproteobacteria bacterium RBG_16_50_11]
MKKIFFVIPTMGGGGAERVFLNILKNIDRQKFHPTLVLFEKKGEYLDLVPDDIPIFSLKGIDVKWKIFGTVFMRLAKKLAKLMVEERPDIILSFMWYTNFIALVSRWISGIRVPIAISERYSLSKSNEGLIEEYIRRVIIKYFYKYADLIIVNSEEMKSQLNNMYNIPQRKILVIYNPVDIDSIMTLSKENDDEEVNNEIPIIIGMGRLTPQKGFSYLIKAIYILDTHSIRCKLCILGDGQEKENLKKLTLELGIQDRVEFLGFKKNPYKYISCSNIFVLSSLYEGFPNAVLEAMILGIPVISTRCPTGPEEIIVDGVNGVLVNPGNEKELADAIRDLLEDDQRRKKIAREGLMRAQSFAVQRIVKEYEGAIWKMLHAQNGWENE